MFQRRHVHAGAALALLLPSAAGAATTVAGTYLEVNYSDDGLPFDPGAAQGIQGYIGSSPSWYEFTYYDGATTIDPFVGSSFAYDLGGDTAEYAGYVKGLDSADYVVDWTTESEADISTASVIGTEYVWTVGDLLVTKTETWDVDAYALFVHFQVENLSGEAIENFRYLHLVDPADTTSARNSTNTRNDMLDIDGDGKKEWAQAQGRSTTTGSNNRAIGFGFCDPDFEQVNFKDGVEIYFSDVDDVGFEGDPGGSSSNFQMIYIHEQDEIAPDDTIMFGFVLAVGTNDTNAKTAYADALENCYDLDGDGFLAEKFGGDDCDDYNADVNGDAEETWYNGIDEDCGDDDDYDQDGDGFVPDEYEGLETVDPRSGEVVEGTGELPGGDCDDTNDAVSPGSEEDWYNGLDEDCAGDNDYDQDQDGYVEDDYVGLETLDPFTGEVVDDGSGVEGGDCDDTDDTIYAGAEETWYDGYDQDCGEDDDYDQDQDGYADSGHADEYGPTYDPGTDEPIEGTGELDATDCNDNDDTVYEGAEEIWYDSYDQDCAGDNDFDQDHDGYLAQGYDDYTTYDPGTGEVVSDGSELEEGDCDDQDENTSPASEEEWYNGLDEDCGGDDDYDQDKDGFADAEHADDYGPTTDTAGNEIDGTGELDATDCDDEDEDINPDAEEVWYNDVDENCDDNKYDQDEDGYPADGYDTNGDGEIDERDGGDCDDTDDEVNPGADETWYNGLDEDCGEDSDYDQDGDGHEDSGYPEDSETVNPGDGEVVDDGSLPNDDCDDTDASIHPDADETWYDGTDSDCAGDDDYDQDGDGHATDDVEYGPTYTDSGHTEEVPGTGELTPDDCDDTDPDVFECEEVPMYKGGGGCAGCAAAPAEGGRGLAGLAGMLAVLGGLWRRRRQG